jgi:two-component system, NtrC family, sensor kinase
VNLSEILQDVLALNNRAIVSKNIDVRQECDAELVVRGFPAQLRQVFSNLIRNAVEASYPEKVLRIRITGYPRDATASDRKARITISDQGTGIPRSNMTRIFDAFFTTKELKGSGIGLWLSAMIIRQHRGHISVRSSTRESGSGTCMSVTIPCDWQAENTSLQEAML